MSWFSPFQQFGGSRYPPGYPENVPGYPRQTRQPNQKPQPSRPCDCETCRLKNLRKKKQEEYARQQQQAKLEEQRKQEYVQKKRVELERRRKAVAAKESEMKRLEELERKKQQEEMETLRKLHEMERKKRREELDKLSTLEKKSELETTEYCFNDECVTVESFYEPEIIPKNQTMPNDSIFVLDGPM
jgi:colicin import membrane protein